MPTWSNCNYSNRFENMHTPYHAFRDRVDRHSLPNREEIGLGLTTGTAVEGGVGDVLLPGCPAEILCQMCHTHIISDDWAGEFDSLSGTYNMAMGRQTVCKQA